MNADEELMLPPSVLTIDEAFHSWPDISLELLSEAPSLEWSKDLDQIEELVFMDSNNAMMHNFQPPLPPTDLLASQELPLEESGSSYIFAENVSFSPEVFPESLTLEENTTSRKKEERIVGKEIDPLALTPEVKDNSDTKQVTQSCASSSTSGKKEWEAWIPEEVQKFFAGISSRYMSGPNASGLSMFEYLSKKVGSKTPEQIRTYYYRQLRRINEVLKPIGTQVDLRSSNEIRIAFICWNEVNSKFTKKGQQTVRIDSAWIRKRLTTQFCNSFMKRRRLSITSQKKKSSAAEQQNNNTAAASSSSSSSQMATSTATKKKRQRVTPTTEAAAKENSNTSSFYSPIPSDDTQRKTGVNILTARKRIKTMASTSATAFLPLKHADEQLQPTASIVVPEKILQPSGPADEPLKIDRTPGKKLKSGKTSSISTSNSNSPTKVKVRFVPFDKQERALVSSAGLQPKVELSMSSNKAISEIWNYMANTKWKKVNPEGSSGQKMLRFLPVGNHSEEQEKAHLGWGRDDHSVSCIDILHRFSSESEKKKGIVTLEYKWIHIEETQEEAGEASKASFTTPIAMPLDLAVDDCSTITPDFNQIVYGNDPHFPHSVEDISLDMVTPDHVAEIPVLNEDEQHQAMLNEEDFLFNSLEGYVGPDLLEDHITESSPAFPPLIPLLPPSQPFVAPVSTLATTIPSAAVQRQHKRRTLRRITPTLLPK